MKNSLSFKLSLTLLVVLAEGADLVPRFPQHGHGGMGDMSGMGASSAAPPACTGNNTPPVQAGPGWAEMLSAMGGISWLMDAAMPEATLAKVEDLKPKYRATAKRKVFRYGPFTLVGKGQSKPPLGFVSMDENGQGFFDLISNGICENDCTVIAGKTGLVFADGKEAGPTDGIQVHHILTTDLSKSINQALAYCAVPNPAPYKPFNGTRFAKVIGSGFVGQGEDNGEIVFTSPDGSYPAGFFIRAKDRFVLLGDFVNHGNVTKDVYVTLDLEYVDGHVGYDSASALLSVTSCKSEDVKMGAAGSGPAETMSNKFEVYVDGYIVTAKGHMHDGGDRMVLYVNEKEVCTSKPIYSPNGIGNETVLTGMTQCNNVFQVKKGDYLKMKSVYDLSKHPLPKAMSAHPGMGMSDAMGMFTMTLAENGEAPRRKSRAIQM
ncbi:hypothetical protein EJ08DRAFT_691495 [Tothia fuscella]|uniref:Uncharacterized protein n=1 Tax=Tothia fuscella TaxID=1048955 RepID=A0A9P4U3S9_9PEZI|nr:hypothetical protein EJ08DRAFT_691495 [Tothia fuscella]